MSLSRKHIILAIIIVMSFAATCPASERYFSLAGGTFSPGNTSSTDVNLRTVDTSYSTGWSAGATIGIALDGGLRLENELVYRQAAAKGLSDDLWALGWMVNVWYDLRNQSNITPYLGGGFGAGRGHVAGPGPVDNSGYGVAYQAGGGVDIKINRGLSLDLGYRYFGIADTSSGNGVGSFNPTGSTVTGGVRVKF